MFDRQDDIQRWLRRVREQMHRGVAFILANNHYQGFSPETCAALRAGFRV